MELLVHFCSVTSARHRAEICGCKGGITFSAMASPTASAACVVAFRLLEKPRQPAEMQDCTRPLVSDSVMIVLLLELMMDTMPACTQGPQSVTRSHTGCCVMPSCLTVCTKCIPFWGSIVCRA